MKRCPHDGAACNASDNCLAQNTCFRMTLGQQLSQPLDGFPLDGYGCATCGGLLSIHPPSPDSLCTNCWEVEHRLTDYLQSDKGKLHVRKLLEEAKGGGKV